MVTNVTMILTLEKRWIQIFVLVIFICGNDTVTTANAAYILVMIEFGLSFLPFGKPQVHDLNLRFWNVLSVSIPYNLQKSSRSRKFFARLIFVNQEYILSCFLSWNNKKILFSHQKSNFACKTISLFLCGTLYFLNALKYRYRDIKLRDKKVHHI